MTGDETSAMRSYAEEAKNSAGSDDLSDSSKNHVIFHKGNGCNYRRDR